ncbi:hypothetical protein NBRC116592_20480 [Colwellia sp. KU-HH00111]|uniref:OmpA family protein n=1 Tax=Colwellia sp. KU-HH00111 TaxID=3127652 RepID=UPI003108F12D
MNTFKITLLAALISSPLAAETFDETWEAGIFVDYIKTSTNKEGLSEWENIDAGKGYGLDLHKIINEKWNVRFELATTYYDIPRAHDIDFGTRFGLDAVYKLEDSNFYVFTGVKRFDNAQDYNALNVGAGYNYQINDRYTVYSEAAVYRDINNGFTDQGIKLGVKYAFGDVKKTSAKKRAKQPVSTGPALQTAMLANGDMDNDGVLDTQDNCNNTPANIKVDAQGCTLYTEKQISVNLNVLFDNDSSNVTNALVNDVARLADFMNEYKSINVVIEGHSSSVGSEQYNLSLSQKRADAVKTILVKQFNVEPSRLTTIGFGESRLLTTGTTAADHKLNRRVVATIETTVKAVVSKD